MKIIQLVKKCVVYKFYVKSRLGLRKSIRILSKWNNFNMVSGARNGLPNSNASKKLFYIGLAEYNNLGDIAISYASKIFIDENASGYDRYYLTENEFWANVFKLRRMITANDLIILQGGGNISDLYPDQQKLRGKVFKEFSDVPMVIFPQSIFFSERKSASKERNKWIKEIKQCKKLTVFLREEKSFNYFRDNAADIKHKLVPDIVLSLSRKNLNRVRDVVLLILRDDKEKNNKISAQSLEKQCGKFFPECTIKYFDTVIRHDVMKEDYVKELEELVNIFSTAKIIVTDRLHALIIAYLTYTPCIAIDNKTGKVKYTYKWLELCPYVEMAENIEEFKDALYKFTKDDFWENRFGNEIPLKEKFEELGKMLR